MKERPILFSAPMVRAILREANPKTHTRRVMKLEHVYDIDDTGTPLRMDDDGIYHPVLCPYGVPGDRLWVRETYACCGAWDHMRMSDLDDESQGHQKAEGLLWFRADGEPKRGATIGEQMTDCGRWRPSIHMPRWASRITLEITGVHVELLQNISEEDAIAEGVELSRMLNDKKIYEDYLSGGYASSAKDSFRTLWNSINGKHPGVAWNDNPWVWVIEFQRVESVS